MTKRTEQDYQAAADWAENEMTLRPDSETALRGSAAAEHGREAIARALGGRPSIDPDAAPGQHAKGRTVRLPAALEAQLLELAAQQNRKPSEILRDAADSYIREHLATA